MAALVVAAVTSGGTGGGGFEAVGLGTSEGPAAEPTDEAWSFPLSEEGLTTVITGEDVVLVTEDAVLVHALDAGDGAELWTAELEGGDLNRAVPLAGGAVLLETEPENDEPRTRLVDARSGEESWEVDGEIPTTYRDHTSADASSIHDLDVVVLIGDDGMVGVDRDSGEVRWEVEDMDDGGACAGLLVLTTDGIGGGDEMVAVDPGSGAEVWSAEGRVGPCRGGRVAVTDGTAITVHDAADGSEVGGIELDDDPGQVIATPLGENLLVQGASSDTGTAFMAIHPLVGGEPVYEREGMLGTPVGDGSTVFAVPVDTPGGGIVVRVADGEELSTTEEDQSRRNDCFGTFGRTQLVLCSSTSTEILALGADDGAERWRIDVGVGEDDITDVHAVGVIGDRVIVATADRAVAYRA